MGQDADHLFLRRWKSLRNKTSQAVYFVERKGHSYISYSTRIWNARGLRSGRSNSLRRHNPHLGWAYGDVCCIMLVEYCIQPERRENREWERMAGFCFDMRGMKCIYNGKRQSGETRANFIYSGAISPQADAWNALYSETKQLRALVSRKRVSVPTSVEIMRTHNNAF